MAGSVKSFICIAISGDHHHHYNVTLVTLVFLFYQCPFVQDMHYIDKCSRGYQEKMGLELNCPKAENAYSTRSLRLAYLLSA